MSAENLTQGPSFEMPPSPPGGEKIPQTPEKTSEQGLEQGGPSREGAPPSQAHAAPALPLPTPMAAPAAAPQAALPPDLSQTAPVTGMIAKDVDLIERQWVDSAKKIINQTHEDPAKQKDQISQLSADYQHRRFNRKLKTDNAEA